MRRGPKPGPAPGPGSDMASQLVLPLPVRQGRGREDFFVTPANALALATLDGGNWPGGRLILAGPEGAGKSHLAAIWATDEGAGLRPAAGLGAAEAPGLAAGGALVLEDVQHLAGDAGGEAALFHLLNLMAAEGGRLLLTADAPPRDWGLTLPDLQSRLEASTLVRLAPPDEALMAAVLVKLFADRQMAVSQSLISWLVTRMERSLGQARALVATLDARALAEGRAITRQMAAEALENLSQTG